MANLESGRLPAHKPNCGPTALAAILGLPVEEVEAAYADRFNKGARWKGRSTPPRLLQLAQKTFGATVKEEARGGSLGRWVAANAMPNRKYLVHVGRHFVAVLDGRVVDQSGNDRLAELSARRVLHAYWIVPSK